MAITATTIPTEGSTALSGHVYDGVLYYMTSDITDRNIHAIDLETGEQSIFLQGAGSHNYTHYLFGVNEYLYLAEFIGRDNGNWSKMHVINVKTNVKQTKNVNISTAIGGSGGWSHFAFQDGDEIGVAICFWEYGFTTTYVTPCRFKVDGFTVTELPRKFTGLSGDKPIVFQRVQPFQNGVSYSVGGEVAGSGAAYTDIYKYQILDDGSITCESVGTTEFSAGQTALGEFVFKGVWYMCVKDENYLYSFDPINGIFRNTGLSLLGMLNVPTFINAFTDVYGVSSTALLKINLLPSNYTYRVCNGDGSVVYFESENNSAITSVAFNEGNNLITFTIRTLTGIITGEYTSIPPEDKKTTGYAFTPNAPRRRIPTNIEYAVNIDESVTFYEVYSTYSPPATTFNINLYKNRAEVNRVDKSAYLVEDGVLTGALREECSLIAPSITFRYSDVPSFNYVYIPIFKRFYFVTGITSVAQNLWRMSLSCDVLMTWREEIGELTAIIARQENSFNPLLIDSELPAQANQNITVTEFPAGGFNTADAIAYPFVLTVVGA